ncbi:hypothetical protein BJ875DRAFT_441313 [Amylocarpus encephaloides]|uniref:Fucose-specific lectin n=1 Tax=Amylocarpus encephaloides TaxID=45428 RepID=A0A9P7YIW7_9HELO|nr:hypothetical protein BJ875DRAFT_441313 [Amylocarpus encephaloides]
MGNEKRASPVSRADSEIYSLKPIQQYYPDDKIVLVTYGPPLPPPPPPQMSEKSPSYPESEQPQKKPSISAQGMIPVPLEEFRPAVPAPVSSEAHLPQRQSRPFWKRHVFMIIAVLLLVIIVTGVLAGVLTTRNFNSNPKQEAIITVAVSNNSMSSVASSGLFLKDGTTWNMQTYWQNSYGTISYRMSLDGVTYKEAQNVTLRIPPRVGSPLTANAVTDSTGVVYLRLFYMSTTNSATMCVMACAAFATSCSTISNNLLPTTVPPSNFTGLSGVTVNEAQDWRVYYYDMNGFLSQLQGNASGFNKGEIIGGTCLNGSSIAAINVNETTNNIVVFYVDNQSGDLYSQQFVGHWTFGMPVSKEVTASWNPTSGLGAAYRETPDQLHVYYTGLDSRVYEFIGSNASLETNTSWAAQPQTQKTWATAELVGSDITAIGWDDQVRFYQKAKGRIAEGALQNTTWTQKFLT